MARKVVDITKFASRYDILSQTPKNYSEDNYFLKELQEKVNAEWIYRPNRVDIGYEHTWGQQDWEPLEVVVQTIKTEKGKDISNDCRRLVFKNIFENRFVIGSKFTLRPYFTEDVEFRVQPDLEDVYVKDPSKMTIEYQKFLLKQAENFHDVWLSTNTNRINFTSDMIVERCNGTLGSVYYDEQNVAHYHYEPVILGRELSSVNLFYNETAVAPQSQLLVIAQHNEYTKQYFTNQRFIVGYDKVYRIKATNKFYSNSTDNPQDIGLMLMYLEITESSPYDNFDVRIAYQQDSDIHIKPKTDNPKYNIKFTTPEEIPTILTSNPITFTATVIESDTGMELPNINVDILWQLENLPAGVDSTKYIQASGGLNGVPLIISRKKIYLNGDLEIIGKAMIPNVPARNKDIEVSFHMVVRQPE